jgi:hypothetical protein
VPLASGTLRVASGSHLTREDHQTGRARLAGWAVPQPFRFRTTRVPIVCRLSDSRQRLSLGNCQRMPFSFAGQAGESAQGVPQPPPGGTGGSPGGVVVS